MLYDVYGGGYVRIGDGKLKPAALDGGRELEFFFFTSVSVFFYI